MKSIGGLAVPPLRPMRRANYTNKSMFEYCLLLKIEN